MSNFKTAEFVSPKHPDKICDQISDAILDAYLAGDPDSRIAVEVAGGHGKVFVVGEVTSKTKKVNIKSIVKRLAGDSVAIIENIVRQSPEISRGVDIGGAGDQGIMVGYATSETAEMLPTEYVLARDLNRHIFNIWPYDGKTQVTTLDNKIHTIVISFQNAPKGKLQKVVNDWLKNQKIASPTEKVLFHINPGGDWNIGGFDADTGLTGRKLIVDNYGPRIPIGGGAFSGKDASKVDRSGAYMARKIAIDYLKKYKANEVYVYLAYAIGYDQPVQATAIIDGVERAVKGYDLSPQGIIKFLDLKTSIFEQTARNGHFGNTAFSWEI